MSESPPVIATASRCRKPTILDGLILIAATAVGFALMRGAYDSFGWGQDSDRIGRLAAGTRLASCVVLLWTLAFFPIRLRDPRPPLREVVRQPGMMACCAVCVSIAIGAITSTPLIWSFLSGRQMNFPLQNIAVQTMSNVSIPHSIVAAWMMLMITGTWRHERGWIDRMGIALAAFWLLSLVFLIILSAL